MKKILLFSLFVLIFLVGCKNESDTTAPVISLNGPAQTTLVFKQQYIESGATATDDEDGTVNVTITGSVDTGTIGTYVITYLATDTAGNTATVQRTVEVILPDGNFILNSPTEEQFLLYIDTISKLDPNGDEDGDGLTNAFEIDNLQLTTLPDVSDTDNDGVLDPDEDVDEDGLTSREEQSFGTNPMNADPDSDELNDKAEQENGTDPNNSDTDNDGLSDSDEIHLGTDPLINDTDRDTILDGDEIYTSEYSDSENGISISVTGIGNISAGVNTEIDEPEADEALIPGLLSKVYEFESQSSFESAIVKIPLTDDIINRATLVSDLRIVFFDDEDQELLVVEEQGISADQTYVWAKLDHFSSYGIVDLIEFNEAFNQPFYGSTRSATGGLDMLFAIDSSGSMGSNDPNRLRVSASQNLITGLTADLDRAGVIDFDSRSTLLQPLTTNHGAAISALNQINASGGTNIGAAVSTAISEFDSNTSGNSSLLILLTDGQGAYEEALTTIAREKGIRIYTVGLGSQVDETLLRSIANGTDGVYFGVSSASQLEELFETLRQETLDTDGDGLSDFAEVNGLRGWMGYTITTNPNIADTDNDGLTDGEEMVAVAQMTDGRLKYNMVSNPNIQDSDSDGISDFAELNPEQDTTLSEEENKRKNPKTDPLKQDTDSDGLKDTVDTYPREYDWYGNELKIGDIILVSHNAAYQDHNGWQRNHRFAMGEWAHAVIYTGDEKTIDSHPENSVPNSPNGGVGVRDIHEFLYAGCDTGAEDKCELPASSDMRFSKYDKISFLRVKDQTDTDRQKAIDHAASEIGTTFDLSADFTALFGLIDESLYCSELVYVSWDAAGVDLKSHFWPWIRPVDLYNNKNTQVIREFAMPAHRPSEDNLPK